jgi:hypothetical protein
MRFLLQHRKGDAPLGQPSAVGAVVRGHIVDDVDLDRVQVRETELSRNTRAFVFADPSDLRGQRW